MAIPDVSPSHQDPVCSALKSLQHVVRRNSGRAHDPDGPEVGGVLKPAHPRQIRRAVSTPVAEKGEDSGFKTVFCHLSLLGLDFPSPLGKSAFDLRVQLPVIKAAQHHGL